MSDATANDDTTPPDRWQLCDGGIEWNVAEDTRLPHSDHFEMSGLYVSVIVHYTVDVDRHLTLTKEVIWPTLRTKEGDVRGYLRRTFGPNTEPPLLLDGRPATLPPVARITIAFGTLDIEYVADKDCRITRTLYPHAAQPTVCDSWSSSASSRSVQWKRIASEEQVTGVYGTYHIFTHTQPQSTRDIYHSATTALSPPAVSNGEMERMTLWVSLENLGVTTPDLVLDVAFQLAKLRAAESVFETKMGRVHSPGGGRYYGGVWANDQAEYSGPLFGYLGETDSTNAALTAYCNFRPYMTPQFAPIPSSLEIEGTIAFRGAGDRGDAAMYAGGAARYALSRGDRQVAEELYPAVQWCLEYCRRKTNADGIVESDSDELEGRFPTGKANLSTSCLTYDGLRRGADLARALGHEADRREYNQRADALEAAIETYFGAMVEGFHTYRYYEGNTTLRAWICLPLCFGIGRNNPERMKGTLDALFSPRLWTPDGLATESGDTVFWDRSTLYALRGAFFAGDTDRALRYLSAYSRRRLLGNHVPYPVEAYPEGDQAHLSAESALYCRVFSEGMFGYVPTGLRSFKLTPRLPSSWPEMTLSLAVSNGSLIIKVTRAANDSSLVTEVKRPFGETLFQETHQSGTTLSVVF